MKYFKLIDGTYFSSITDEAGESIATPPEGAVEIAEHEWTAGAFAPITLEQTRAMNYPGFREFADAFVAERLGDPAPMKAYLQKCAQVKDRFPKPPEPVSIYGDVPAATLEPTTRKSRKSA
jgi:hypothetical protein